MTLPRHSSLGVFFRQSFRHSMMLLTLGSEPVRSKLRDRARHRAEYEPVRLSSNCPPLLVLIIYRLKNAPTVQMLLKQLDSKADVRLWALDEISSELASKTIGCGPGVRFSHLNRLYGSRPVAEGSWIVLADDDVFFVKGGLPETIDLMRRAEFSLAQPGQSLLGWWSFLFTVSRPWMTARDTNYVEQGPLIIANPEFSALLLPFPEGDDMGWGIEALWYRHKDQGFRVGVIDGCRMVHSNRPANSYSVAPQMQSMKVRLNESGLQSIWQLQSVNGRWWKWKPAPSWSEL